LAEDAPLDSHRDFLVRGDDNRAKPVWVLPHELHVAPPWE